MVTAAAAAVVCGGGDTKSNKEIAVRRALEGLIYSSSIRREGETRSELVMWWLLPRGGVKWIGTTSVAGITPAMYARRYHHCTNSITIPGCCWVRHQDCLRSTLLTPLRVYRCRHSHPVGDTSIQFNIVTYQSMSHATGGKVYLF